MESATGGENESKWCRTCGWIKKKNEPCACSRPLHRMVESVVGPNLQCPIRNTVALLKKDYECAKWMVTGSMVKDAFKIASAKEIRILGENLRNPHLVRCLEQEGDIIAKGASLDTCQELLEENELRFWKLGGWRTRFVAQTELTAAEEHGPCSNEGCGTDRENVKYLAHPNDDARIVCNPCHSKLYQPQRKANKAARMAAAEVPALQAPNPPAEEAQGGGATGDRTQEDTVEDQMDIDVEESRAH